MGSILSLIVPVTLARFGTIGKKNGTIYLGQLHNTNYHDTGLVKLPKPTLQQCSRSTGTLGSRQAQRHSRRIARLRGNV